MDRLPRLRRHRVPMPTNSRTAIAISGLAASLLLHGLLFTPLMWGGRHLPRRMPDQEGAAARQQTDESAGPMMVVFQEDALAIHDAASEGERDPHFILPQSPILSIAHLQLPTSQLSPLDDADDTPATEADGDQSGRSMMCGRFRLPVLPRGLRLKLLTRPVAILSWNRIGTHRLGGARSRRRSTAHPRLLLDTVATIAARHFPPGRQQDRTRLC
jgi:hypothetical protein